MSSKVTTRGAVLLRGWREREGLTVNAAAKLFQTDRETYARWEGTGIPSLRFLAALEDLAGVPMRSWLEAADREAA